MSAAVAAIVLLLGTVSLDLMSKELQGQVGQLPHRILRLAARRLPPALRTRYFEEWEADLNHILHRHEARPITRLLLGFRFAASLLRGARRLRIDHMSANVATRQEPRWRYVLRLWLGWRYWVTLPDSRAVIVRRRAYHRYSKRPPS